MYLLGTFNSRRRVCFWEKAPTSGPSHPGRWRINLNLMAFSNCHQCASPFLSQIPAASGLWWSSSLINPPHICLNQAFSVQFAFLPRGTRWQVASGGNSLSTQLAPTCQSVYVCATIVIIIVMSIIIIITTIESVIIFFSSDLIWRYSIFFLRIIFSPHTTLYLFASGLCLWILA